MLFNSPEFLIGFLPIVLAGFLLLAGSGRKAWAGAWLTLSSLFFYGYWNPRYVPLLVASMTFNYVVGRSLSRKPRRLVLSLGIAGNVLLLGYFKYTDFFLNTVNQAFGAAVAVPSIVLPLAISFFTFQQIAYLSDAYDGAACEHNFANYCLFVTFFPHLIAGPITHHREMLPQFADADNFRPRWDFLGVGATLFFVGLFKKVLIADHFATVVKPVFAAATAGPVSSLDGWGGSVAYALQIYFDFSGYTDMAIGLGMMFCIRLPQNFNSPYKARNIVDYWARWHMTLTRFLTAYIYNPISVRIMRARAAKGLPPPRRGRMSVGAWATVIAFPTMLTMFVSGLWHGAGWQFIVFGLLHGFYLCVVHGFQALKAKLKLPIESKRPLVRGASVLLTFVCVLVALVFFRASDLHAAGNVLRGMVGAGGLVLHPSFLHLPGVQHAVARFGLTVSERSALKVSEVARIALMLAVVWALPNAQQWLRLVPTALQPEPRPSWLQRIAPFTTWRPSVVSGLAIGGLACLLLLRALSAAPTEFLYFQF